MSRVQFEYARSVDPQATNPTFLHRDWLENGLPDDAYDAVIAIESMSHVRDTEGFCAEAYRVLKPGGRFVTCVWLARSNARRQEIRHLLRPICTEGRLAGLGTRAEVERVLTKAGFVLAEVHDFSKEVRRTWSICARRMLGRLRQSEYRHFLFDRSQPNRIFALTVLRLLIAYRIGAMGYGMFVAEKRP